MWGLVKVATLFCVAAALSKAAAGVQPSNLPEIESLFLGTVEGKSYFADNSEPRTWDAANIACASIGMRLASVETSAQKNFLAGIENPQFYAHYWTAGRDAASPQQFVWNHNNVSVSENFDSFSYYTEPKTCVLFRKGEGFVAYYSIPCADTRNGNGEFGALCESV